MNDYGLAKAFLRMAFIGFMPVEMFGGNWIMNAYRKGIDAYSSLPMEFEGDIIWETLKGEHPDWPYQLMPDVPDVLPLSDLSAMLMWATLEEDKPDFYIPLLRDELNRLVLLWAEHIGTLKTKEEL